MKSKEINKKGNTIGYEFIGEKGETITEDMVCESLRKMVFHHDRYFIEKTETGYIAKSFDYMQEWCKS